MINGKPTDGNFFDLNTEHQIIPEIAALIRSHGEEAASYILWSIWYVHHPDSSIFDMKLEEKQHWVRLNYCKGMNWEDNKVIELIAAFPKFAMSQEARHYRNISMLYEKAVSEAHLIEDTPKILASLKSLNIGQKELQVAKDIWESSRQSNEKSQGKNQSGWISKA